MTKKIGRKTGIALAVVTIALHLPALATEWGYEGEGAPDRWADLDPAFEMCRKGRRQSPVDLTGAVPIDDAGIERRLGAPVLTGQQRARVMDLVDNGHTIQVTTDMQMSARLGDVTYQMVQFHFHAPSEHTIDGRHAPIEVHFVHKSAAGELAVIGILVEEGEHNEIWEPMIASLPSNDGDSLRIDGLQIDMNKLRPIPGHYYRYVGSLTIPPCSEGVQWIVLADPGSVSSEQMTAVVSNLHHNNRPVQPLGERKIGIVVP